MAGKRKPPFKIVPPNEFCSGWRVKSRFSISKPEATQAAAQRLCDDMNAAVDW